MKLRFRPVLTPGGFAFLIIALAVLIRSLIAHNAYEILLSGAALFFLLAFGITGLWKSRKLKLNEYGWKPPSPMTADADDDSHITGFEARLPLFFRQHFIVKGRFFPSGRSSGRGFSASAETSAARGKTSAQLSLDFPMSGVFQGEGYCVLRDIFGFFSFGCGAARQRTLNVRSSPCFGHDYRINVQSGAEDRRNKTSSDEERYYMREYAPGDRFRDINWKSSEKVDALITRISPDNQEKVSRIEVYFRNYSSINTCEAFWLLDRAKARLTHFLRSLMEMQSSYIFNVRACGKNWEIEDSGDLDTFLDELAALSFSPPKHETAVPRGEGELYIFSTACDIGLHGFITACNPRPVSLFIIQPADSKKTKDGDDAETLRINRFITKGCIPSPRLFFGNKVKHLGAQAGRTENIYAGIKL